VISGVLFSVLAFSGAAGNHVAVALLKRMSARAIIALACVIGGTALAVFAGGSSDLLPTLVGGTALCGLCIGAASTSAYTAAGAVIPRDVHTTGFSFLTSASLAGLALSPIVSGFVAARSIRAVFLGGVMLLILLAIVVRRLMVERQPVSEQAPPVEES
jgi:MFS family permease